MKFRFFILIFSLIAGGGLFSATAPLMGDEKIDEERIAANARVYNGSGLVEKFAEKIYFSISAICEIGEYGVTREVFLSKLKNNRSSLENSVAPDEIKKTGLSLFDAFVSRILVNYNRFFEPCDEKNSAIKVMSDETLGKEMVYMAIPDPYGTIGIEKGSEQKFCDYAMDLINLRSEWELEKLLLMGARINCNQLVMFLTKSPQLVKGGQVYFADKSVQRLCAGYASGVDAATLGALEVDAADSLVSDKCVELRKILSLTAIPGDVYPELEENIEVFGRDKILQELRKRTL